jgi:hypothetical protein
MDVLVEMGFEAGLCRRAMEIGGSFETALELLTSGALLVDETSRVHRVPDLRAVAVDAYTLSREGELEIMLLSRSQYSNASESRGASSACTAIACVGAISILRKQAALESERGFSFSGRNADTLESELNVALDTGARIASACQRLSSSGEHLEAADVWGHIDHHGFALSEATQAIYTKANLMEMQDIVQRRAVELRRPLAVVLTKPPESVCLLYFPPASPVPATAFTFPTEMLERGSWVLWDSHPRSHLGLPGAAAVCAGRTAILHRLLEVFPPFAGEAGDEDNLMLQLMYNSFQYSLVYPETSSVP